MTSVNYSEKFCSNAEIDQIIKMVDIKPMLKRHLINDFNSIYQTPKPTLLNTLNLLCESGVLQCQDEKLFLIDRLYAGSIRSHLLSQSIFAEISGAFKFDENQVILDSFLLPEKYSSVIFLLALVGVASRPSQSGYRRWPIQPEFISAVLSLIKKSNDIKIDASRSLSLDGLNKINEKKSEYGRQAELWFLNFERNRLAGHPFADQVKMVSDDNVSAGYDIVSFHDKSSLVYDRYIEVKSFVDTPRIFMSANELETAKNLGNSYFLVLVNRSKMMDSSYLPREIANPYEYFFGVNKSDWVRITAASYEIAFDFQ